VAVYAATRPPSPVGNFKEIRPVGAALLHADGRTEGRINMTKVTGAFCDYANTHKTEENRKVSCSCLKDKIKELICFVWHMRTTKPLDTYMLVKS
jgi:hypothetical protein